MNKKIESILETFTYNEITATDSRIAAIYTFVETLKAELRVYAGEIPTDPVDKEYFSMILKLFKSMISTYDEEIKLLKAKREKMQEHLSTIHSVVAYLQPAGPADLHVN